MNHEEFYPQQNFQSADSQDRGICGGKSLLHMKASPETAMHLLGYALHKCIWPWCLLDPLLLPLGGMEDDS